MGTYIYELNQDLKTANQMFEQYQEQVSAKFDSIDALYSSRETAKETLTNAKITAEKAIQRESVVITKPKLVEKKVNESFSRLQTDIAEITK